jgi:hypothetical protein
VRLPVHRIVLAAFYVLFLGTAAWFAVGGLSFYLTALPARPRHPLFWAFKPGGDIGHPLGVAGSAMMIVMLAYSLRKRLPAMRRMGPTSVWLDYHILLGISGPIFVILHSSFKVQGLVALSFWSMIAVALSGVAGRYLYRQIPRTREGAELSLAEVERLDVELSRQLIDQLGLSESEVGELDGIAARGTAGGRSLAMVLLRHPAEAFALKRRVGRFVRRHPRLRGRFGKRFAEVVKRKARLHRRIVMWNRLHELFHYWHVVHKPFAIVMYLFMVVHVVVAWLTGYGWPSS